MMDDSSCSRIRAACASAGVLRFTSPHNLRLAAALPAAAAPRLKAAATDFVVREVTLEGVACGTEADKGAADSARATVSETFRGASRGHGESRRGAVVGGADPRSSNAGVETTPTKRAADVAEKTSPQGGLPSVYAKSDFLRALGQNTGLLRQVEALAAACDQPPERNTNTPSIPSNHAESIRLPPSICAAKDARRCIHRYISATHPSLVSLVCKETAPPPLPSESSQTSSMNVPTTTAASASDLVRHVIEIRRNTTFDDEKIVSRLAWEDIRALNKWHRAGPLAETAAAGVVLSSTCQLDRDGRRVLHHALAAAGGKSIQTTTASSSAASRTESAKGARAASYIKVSWKGSSRRAGRKRRGGGGANHRRQRKRTRGASSPGKLDTLYLRFTLQKNRVNQADALQLLSRRLSVHPVRANRVSPAAFGIAGTKDKVAITFQKVTVPVRGGLHDVLSVSEHLSGASNINGGDKKSSLHSFRRNFAGRP